MAVTLARAAYYKLFEVIALEDDSAVACVPRTCRTWRWRSPRPLSACGLRHRGAGASSAGAIRADAVDTLLAADQAMLDDIIQISPKPLPDSEQFFPDWIAFLPPSPAAMLTPGCRGHSSVAGHAGLAALARAEGKQRPHAYVDWCAALEREGQHQEALAAAQEALRTLPNTSPSVPLWRTSCAPRRRGCTGGSPAGWTVGGVCGPANPGATSRRVGSHSSRPRADTSDAPGGSASAVRSRTPAPSAGTGSLGGRPRETRWPDTSVLAHAYLLAGDWKAAHQLAVDEQVLGWSSRSSAQGLMVSCVLVHLSGRLPGSLPPNLAQLWQWGLQDSAGLASWHGGESGESGLLSRLQCAYVECLPMASLPDDKQAEMLAWCLDVTKRRVNAIVSNQHRGSYNRAAVLLAACAETLRLRGNDREAQALLDDAPAVPAPPRLSNRDKNSSTADGARSGVKRGNGFILASGPQAGRMSIHRRMPARKHPETTGSYHIGMFICRAATVARPLGVLPRIIVPSSVQSKWSCHGSFLGLNNGTGARISGSMPSCRSAL